MPMNIPLIEFIGMKYSYLKLEGKRETAAACVTQRSDTVSRTIRRNAIFVAALGKINKRVITKKY